MFGAPSIVSEVDLAAIIAALFIRSMATGRRRGPQYPSPGKGCQGTASRHQRGPQLPIFKAERHAAVRMVFLMTFDNMTVSFCWGLIAGHKKGGDTLT